MIHYGLLPRIECVPELGPDEAIYYQSLIGVMWWMVEIRYIDINIKMSLLLIYSAMPRQGYLEAVLHIMGHLTLKNNF